jgi:hypothetical protein
MAFCAEEKVLAYLSCDYIFTKCVDGQIGKS